MWFSGLALAWLQKAASTLKQFLHICVSLCIHFIHLATIFHSYIITSVQVLAIEFVVEFVHLAIEFVTLAIEFVHLAIEFVPWAIEFIALARKFVMTEEVSRNQPPQLSLSQELFTTVVLEQDVFVFTPAANLVKDVPKRAKVTNSKAKASNLPTGRSQLPKG